MKNKRIQARLSALEQIFALPPPVQVRMSDGRLEEIAVTDTRALAFVLRILGNPVSREAQLICDAVAVLQQPGRLIELLQGIMENPRQILHGEITPDVVQLGLCTLDQYCGIQPQTEEDLEARIKAVYRDA